jgi:diguanylate cyclase (GGDEF)-like protein/PAS domain S-box-containing protein
MPIKTTRLTLAHTSPWRSLVVHADAGRRREVEALLAARGHHVAVCSTANAAFGEHEREPFALVLVDDELLPPPQMPALYARFRAAAGGAPLLLAMTRDHDPERAVAALAAGADEVLLVAAVPTAIAFRLDVAEQRALRRAERQREHERLRQLEKAVETMQIGVTITDLDRRILYTNPADAVMHGWEPGELIGRDARVFAAPGSGREMPRASVLALSRWKRESVNARRDGTLFPVQVTSDLVRDDAGIPVAIVTCCEDISERRLADEALRESEERYALAARGAQDGLWDWNLRRDEVYYSERWLEMLGYTAEEVGSRPDGWLDRIHPGDRESVQQTLERHLRGETAHFESSHRVLHREGTYRWVLVRGLAVRADGGLAYRMAGSLSDLTGRGVHDPLTGLPNRAFFASRLADALERWQRGRSPGFALLLVDVDRFQLINDGLGPVAGDGLLVALAERLDAAIGALTPGTEATLARAGGDEFLVLLEAIPHVGEATRLAERIRSALQSPFVVEGRPVFTSASVGIVSASPGHQRPEELVRDAEVAMHRAKSLGGARFQVFDKQMHERALARLRVESDLRRAIAAGELLLHYQPIVELRGGRVRRVEALVRWRSPHGEVLSPEHFIPVAEESELVLELDRWVLATACRQLRDLRRELGVELAASVNLSGRHFSRLEVVDHVRAALEAAALPADAVELEVTEGVLVAQPELAQRVLAELKAIGVRLCLDDFGTGYSSLSYLHQFPIDGLKVDRSFIAALGDGNGRGRIVETIVGLARHLGLGVVAEGVETAEQRAHLETIGCELAQGYLFARPMPWEDLQRLLAAGGVLRVP